MHASPRLLFVVTEDWYFASHRLDLARAARAAGFRVGVATRVADGEQQIRDAGIELIPLQHMRRSSRNPLVELRAIEELTDLYRAWTPDIVHLIAAKPIVYGGIAARRARVPGVVGALAGLGYAFSSPSLRARLIRPALLAAYRAALRQANVRVIVQNPQDGQAIEAARLAASRQVRLVRGSGVDPTRFSPTPEPTGTPVAMLVGRMLQDKGVREFVEAARLLRDRGTAVRCVLVGDADTENPSAIPRAELDRWHSEGAVEWWGHRSDMPATLALANIVCLPSYREGLPKVLLEAAACERALIATDVPGCREVAIQGETALLVPPRDVARLAEAIATLATSADQRRAFGQQARRHVTDHFTADHVNRATLAIYAELLPTTVADRRA